MASTAKGAKMAHSVAAVLAIPINVPACTGAMSMWLTLNPESVAELNPTAITKSTMVRDFSVEPTKTRQVKATAGTNSPERSFDAHIFLNALLLGYSKYWVVL